MTTATAVTPGRRSTYRGERRRLQVRVSTELAERLEQAAATERRSVSDYLALLIERAAKEGATATP